MTLSLMTYNIRYNTARDAENAWPYRKERVLDLIKSASPDVFGLQEALYDQLEFLALALEDYAYVGVGREDGQMLGEFSPLFYRERNFKLLEQGTFWLSETPSVIASKGWDANLPRIATWAKFQANGAPQTFCIFNTHFDHLGEVSRQNSSRLILDKMSEIDPSVPSFLMGDLNAEPDSSSYQILSEVLQDTFLTARAQKGDSLTYRGFREHEEKQARIDYIFASRRVAVRSASTLEQNLSGVYPSDHVPVLIHTDLS